jgi:hypothetical protein
MENNDLHTNKESCIEACCTVICITARKDKVPKAPLYVLQDKNNLSKMNEDKINFLD